MSRCKAATGLVCMLLAAGGANGQLIVEDFDDHATGEAPKWKFWTDGASGNVTVDDSIYQGSAGKAVKLTRDIFNGTGFGFGRNFRPLDGPATLTYYFRVDSTVDEILTAVGGNNADGEVAWWVGVGGTVGTAIGTFTKAGGWNPVLDVSADTWYGVTLEIDPATHTYDITVWEDGSPSTTATETGISFVNGLDVDTIDQIQFGNFSNSTVSSNSASYIDDVTFVGSRVLEDGFESGNTAGWSNSTRPLTVITSCGQVVTTDAILNDDLTCASGTFESAGVEFGTSNIFLDLNGHTISGHPVGIGVKIENVTGATVKNGNIEDFLAGVNVFDSSVVSIRDLSISNLIEDDPDEFLPGIRVTLSQDVLVQDCFVEFLPVAHKEAIVVANSDIFVDNVEVKNASVGVNISGSCDTSPKGSDVTVINSRFVDVTIAGVLAQCTEVSRVAHNEFDHNEMGVLVDNVNDQSPGNISGLVIKENSIHDGYLGVHFMGNFNCSILNNVMHDGWRGIYVDSTMGCPPDEHQEGCFYATGNLISGNHVTDYFIDLSHHPYATGNTWTDDNICETTEGAEIPACIAP